LGKFQIELRPTTIAHVVEAAVTTARPAAQEREVRLKHEISINGDDVIAADANRMQQVIGNILSNAIKFSPRGTEVDLRVDRVNGSARIIIADQGEGIDPSVLPFVFDRLRQVEW